MRVKGKSVLTDPLDPFEIFLADDDKEVRGFGQPITPHLAKKMYKKYADDYFKAAALVDLIKKDTSGKYDDLKKGDNFKAMDRLMQPKNHIVSGVFGKEILLQILSQKGCEGIRYIFGQYHDKQCKTDETTIILLGVKETGEPENPGCKKIIAGSEPIPSADFFRNIDENNEQQDPLHPPVGEVHNSSLTVQEVVDKFGVSFEKAEYFVKESVRVIFGKY